MDFARMLLELERMLISHATWDLEELAQLVNIIPITMADGMYMIYLYISYCVCIHIHI